MPEILFEETLRFRQPQLWIPLLALFAGTLGALAYFPAKNPGGFTLSNLLAPTICLVVFGLVAALLYASKLETRVSRSGLHIRFFPLALSFHDFSWKDISGMRAAAVRPLRDFGGWGLRYGRKGKAYIVTGDTCVEFELADGSRLYVNTLEAEKFLAALTRSSEAASQKLP